MSPLGNSEIAAGNPAGNDLLEGDAGNELGKGSSDINSEFLKKLNQQIVQKDNLIKLLQLQIRNLKTQLESGSSSGKEELQKALNDKAAEAEKLQSELDKQKAGYEALEQEKNEQIKSLNKILEDQNSTDNSSSKALALMQKQAGNMQQELETLREELKGAKTELASEHERFVSKSAELEEVTGQFHNLVQQQEADKKAKSELEEQIDHLKAEVKKSAEESESMRDELTAAKMVPDNTDEINKLREELASAVEESSKLRTELQNTEQENSNLKQSLSERTDAALDSPEAMKEIEQLSGQVADQLISIQEFQNHIQSIQQELDQRNSEVDALRKKLSESKPEVSQDGLIPVEGENAIISSFIDFFDGLESVISKNPIPELQTLHSRLLERLIVPNHITVMQCISQTFDPNKHIATDYFHSSKFPEKCIVFESEKGYAKGDSVVKKARVWVVQNLYNCSNCGATQSNADSRFCHMCGAPIKAPNGLPIDKLPEFVPSAITYDQFSACMLEKGNVSEAKRYILSGLELDPSYVPLILRYADILSTESEFSKALEMLNKAESIKADPKTEEKIKTLEGRLNIYNQAKALNLTNEEIEKLLKLIQK